MPTNRTLHRGVALAICVPVFWLAADPADALGTCQGKAATVESTGGSVVGTDGDDVILGTGVTHVTALGGNDTICVRGGTVAAGSGDDSLELLGVPNPPITADLGDGDDSLVIGLGATATPERAGAVQGGAGTDTLVLAAEKNIGADLAGGSVKVRQENGYTAVLVDAFENVEAVAPRVGVGGDKAGNRVKVNACFATVRADKGNDRVRLSFDSVLGTQRLGGCPKGRHARFFGQDGKDKLVGNRFEDKLVGGGGRDVAVGRGGDDDCRAEVERRC